MSRDTHIAKVAIKENKERAKKTLIPAFHQAMRDRESSGKNLAAHSKRFKWVRLSNYVMGICHLIVFRKWILTWTATLSKVCTLVMLLI